MYFIDKLTLSFRSKMARLLMCAILTPVLPVQAGSDPAGLPLTVYKDANCGCCEKWLNHVNERGFHALAHDTDALTEIKRAKGVPASLQSCHTSVSAEGFVFEGHIPARFIASFLASVPQDAIGLSVPAMPVGSPGMEYEHKFRPFEVLLLKADGSSQVLARVNSLEESLQ
jgi:hypothetical protein